MTHKKKIGIIGAMASETVTLSALMQDKQQKDAAGLHFWTGTLEGHEVVLVRCGVGKVNAARCTQALIDHFVPDAIINTGIAGGLAPGLAVGDIVIGAHLLQHDFDVSAFGHARGYLCTGIEHEKPTLFDSDAELVQWLKDAAGTVCPERCLREGIIASGDVFVAHKDMKQDIWDTFGADATEMEGAAIAQVAAANGVPFVVIRAISDLADGTAAASIDDFEQQTADISAAIIVEMLKNQSIIA